MDSSLKQRANASTAGKQTNSTTPTATDVSSLNLLELNPDFVLKVQYLIDLKTLNPTPEAQIDLNRLIKTLDLNKFFITIRPDSNSNHLLVFIKLNALEFEKQLEKSIKIDSIYGVDQQISVSSITTADRLRVIYNKLTSPKDDDGCEITIGSGNWSFVKSCIPVANFKSIQDEFKNSKKSAFKFFNSELNAKESTFILENFGSKYALYFKFIGTYLNWLLPLSLIGVLSNSFLGIYSKFFTVLNLNILVGFYLNWYSVQSKLSNDWKLTNVSKLTVSRNTESKDPEYKVIFKQFMFLPIAIGAALTLVFYQLLCFIIEILITELYQGPLKQLLSLIPTILVSSIVPVVTIIYTLVVNKYLMFENSSTEYAQNKSFLIKLFVLNFLATYMALFISSFIYLPLGYKLNPYLSVVKNYADSFSNSRTFLPNIPIKNDVYEINPLRLNNQYKYFILINQIVGLVLEFILPQVLSKVLNHPNVQKLIGQPEAFDVSLDDSEEEKEFLSEIRSNLIMPAYEVNDEYRQLVMQFGFLVMFGPVWSMGPLISLIIDLIQSKFDYFKLIKFVQLPIPNRTENAYPWTLFLRSLILIGSVSSVCITFMYDGGDILSSFSQSAVKYDWFYILPMCLLSYLSVTAVLSFGETFIDSYYSKASIAISKREVSVNDELKRLSEKSTASSNVNNVEDLIKFANILPKQISLKKKIETSKRTDESDLNEKKIIDEVVKQGKASIDGNLKQGFEEDAKRSSVALP